MNGLNYPKGFPNFELDVFQIMPNHMHGIIVLNDVGAGFTPAQKPPKNNDEELTDDDVQLKHEDTQGLGQQVIDDENRAGVNPAPTVALEVHINHCTVSKF